MSIYKSQQKQQSDDLSSINHTIRSNRPGSQPGYAVYVTRHATGDIEILARYMQPDETLHTSGGGKRQHTDKDQMDERVLKESVRRAKKTIRTSCLNLQTDRILTLTFRENITDLTLAWKIFRKFSKAMRERFDKRWRYVVVPEYQKRGAVHFHLAISGYLPIISTRNIWNKAVGDEGGSVNITNPDQYKKNNTSWNPKRVIDYISKYISKSDQVEFNRKRYAKGGDIPEPIKLFGWVIPSNIFIETILLEIATLLSPLQITSLYQLEDFEQLTIATTLF